MKNISISHFSIGLVLLFTCFVFIRLAVAAGVDVGRLTVERLVCPLGVETPAVWRATVRCLCLTAVRGLPPIVDISGWSKFIPHAVCPQRDERQPWTGDHNMGAWDENFIFDNATLYAKWADDMREAQREDGCIPDICPSFYNYLLLSAKP